MGPPSSAESASAAVNAAGASPVARPRLSGRGFPDDIIALGIRWYVRYRLSYAELSEWLAERGVLVDQSTIYRGVQRFLPIVWRGDPKAPRPCWSQLASGRDVRPNSRALALHLSRHRRARPDRRCLCVAFTRPS